jgi:hypothetical protein
VIASKKATIKWRMQTYAGPALAAHVCKPAIDAFNKAANGEMVIKLYNADQLVPTGELFRAMQKGTIDCVQSDDDSIAVPVDVPIFPLPRAIPCSACPWTVSTTTGSIGIGGGSARWVCW